MCLWAAFFVFMNWFKNKYNTIFFGFILSIIVVFFYFRPLNSPWHKFIAGDGLGYYSYLPAKYIYHDNNYEFKWFNTIYNQNYAYSSFNTPDENFMVQYKERRINKYYQGLSFIWLPFFTVAHFTAKVFHFPADGYSLPYQLSIGLASLCFLFLGLFYLRKLIQKLFKDEFAATIIPIVIFYGTYLFYYSLFLNSLSHVYSFAFVSAFIYYAYSYFNDLNKKTTSLLLSLLCLAILVTIRPLNGLIILIVPALIPKHFFKEKQKLQFQKYHLFIVFILFADIVNVLSVSHTQTGAYIPYTYVNEKFYFNNPKLYDVLFSYHAGLFIYVPIALISLFGIFFLQTSKQKIIFPVILILVVYIYSSWWYWPITSRALIDFYPIVAILLSAVLHKTMIHKKIKLSFVTLLFFLVGYHQLKSMQLHNGILDENYTHSELFWRNFFKIHKSNSFTIPPSSIIKQIAFDENFETKEYLGNKSKKIKHQGLHSVLLDKEHPFSDVFEYKIPIIFKEKGIKKIRLSFWCYFKDSINTSQIYLKFFDSKNQLVSEIPFYINKDVIQYNAWDYKEFGYEISDEELKNNDIHHIQIFIWNNEGKSELYIDDVKVEFIITDKSYEIIQ